MEDRPVAFISLQMTGNNNLCGCLISWVHVGKCLHIAARFMSDLRVWAHVLSLGCSQSVVEVLKRCKSWHVLHSDHLPYPSSLKSVALFNPSCDLQCPLLAGNAVCHVGMTPGGDVWDRLTLLLWFLFSTNSDLYYEMNKGTCFKVSSVWGTSEVWT